MTERKKNHLQLPIMVFIIKQSVNRKSNYCGVGGRLWDSGGSRGTALILFH